MRENTHTPLATALSVKKARHGSSMTTLAARMRSLARSGHPRSSELIQLANELDIADEAYFADQQLIGVVSWITAWNRAYALWHLCTNERLGA